MRSVLTALLPLALLLVPLSCDEGVVDVGGDDGSTTPRDAPPTGSEGGTKPIDGGASQLPGPGEICPKGECADVAVCLAGICYAKCSQPEPGCNDVADGCKVNESCIGATSFTDACFPADAKVGELCGPSRSGARCEGGSVCLRVNSGAPARCMKLCKYTCPNGVRCQETTSNCKVCVQ